jgi:hypothetical protein
MVNYTLRFIKRFAVLIPGIVIAYFSALHIFPFIEKRLPLGLAIFLTYVLTAYVLIPALIRVIRIVFPPRHLPLYCVTPDGFASDPINIGIIGSRRELISAMQKSGWYMADPKSPQNVIRHVLASLANLPYSNAPMSNLYLFGRKQDLGFEIPLGNTGHRHHVRFWATTYSDRGKLSIHSIHWHKRREHILADDSLLWVGAASLDQGFTLIRHNIQITHMIHPDTDRERELIVNRLREAGLAKSVRQVHLSEPYKLTNRGWRAHLRTDAKMAVVKLKG